jgi:hypothetical protein
MEESVKQGDGPQALTPSEFYPTYSQNNDDDKWHTNISFSKKIKAFIAIASI